MFLFSNKRLQSAFSHRDLFGLDIQQPFGRYILQGRKTIETREYELPSELVGREVYLGDFSSLNPDKVLLFGKVKFGKPFIYASKTRWMADQGKHMVDDNKMPKFAWKESLPKFGWPVLLLDPYPAPGFEEPLSERTILFKQRIIRSVFRFQLDHRASKL